MNQATKAGFSTTALAAQIRAARGLLGWSRARLAASANVPVGTVRSMESPAGPRTSLAEARAAVLRTLEWAGVEFTDDSGPGVRLKPKAGFLRPEELTSETDL